MPINHRRASTEAKRLMPTVNDRAAIGRKKSAENFGGAN
jgi:hypothetical protein